MVFAHRRCLVLNRNWSPITIISLQRAITMLVGSDKARIIDPSNYQTFSWDEWSRMRPQSHEDRIIGANIDFRVPEVILLSKYDRLPPVNAIFNRKNLFKRDNHVCQYCNSRLHDHELTVDHVVPKSQGGKTTWENTVCCCSDCNNKKGGLTPSQANMKLIRLPKQPNIRTLKYDKPIESWCVFLGEN